MPLEQAGVPSVRRRRSSIHPEVGEGTRVPVGRGRHEVGRCWGALGCPQVRLGTRCVLCVVCQLVLD